MTDPIMKVSEEDKEWIDNATYKELLYRWRNAPAGDSIFDRSSESSSYYALAMNEKRISDANHTATSKAIGWDI